MRPASRPPLPPKPPNTREHTSQAKLRVLHERKVREVTVRLGAPARLVPVHIDNRPPSYFILGGLVFTPITVPLLRSEYGKEFDYDAPVKLLDKMMHGLATAPGQQVVVLSQVLAADVNVGYEDIVNTQVLRVNGRPISNLAELVAAAEGGGDGGDRAPPYTRLDLDYNQVVILGRKEAAASMPAILEQHCISADRSEDLRPAASAGAGPAPARSRGKRT